MKFSMLVVCNVWIEVTLVVHASCNHIWILVIQVYLLDKYMQIQEVESGFHFFCSQCLMLWCSSFGFVELSLDCNTKFLFLRCLVVRTSWNLDMLTEQVLTMFDWIAFIIPDNVAFVII